MHFRNNVLRNNWPSRWRLITGAARLLSHADFAEYMSHVFRDGFDDKQARFLQHSSHFDNTVLQIHHELSQAESLRRHVRTHD